MFKAAFLAFFLAANSLPVCAAGQVIQAAGDSTKTPRESKEELKLWLGALAAAIVIILFLRRASEPGIGMPRDFGPASPSRPQGARGPGAENKDGFNYFLEQPGINTVDGVEFTADMYSDDTVTVEIELEEEPEGSFELNARKGAVTEMPKGEPGRIAAELLSLGADYIDAGFNTERVAAEFPASKLLAGAAPAHGVKTAGKAALPRPLLEKTVRLLIRMKDSLEAGL